MAFCSPCFHFLLFFFLLFLLLFSLCENYYFLAIFKYKPAMAKKMADIFGRRFKDMFFNFSTFRILKAWKNDTKTHGNYCIRITSNKLKTFISSSYNIMISLFSLLFIFSARCSNTVYCLSRKLTINKNFLCKYFL